MVRLLLLNIPLLAARSISVDTLCYTKEETESQTSQVTGRDSSAFSLDILHQHIFLTLLLHPPGKASLVLFKVHFKPPLLENL